MDCLVLVCLSYDLRAHLELAYVTAGLVLGVDLGVRLTFEKLILSFLREQVELSLVMANLLILQVCLLNLLPKSA